jgi:hypothetical protein
MQEQPAHDDAYSEEGTCCQVGQNVGKALKKAAPWRLERVYV